MTVPGRTLKISSVIAVICIVIYIAAISYGAIQIITNIGERRDRAEREFQDLADRASSSAVFLGFMSEAYQETIMDFLASSDTLLGVIITGSSGEYAFERYPGSGIAWVGNSPRLKAGFGYPGMHPYMNLTIEGQRNVTIQAIYSYIDNDYLIWVMKNTLLAVLISLALAFITLLFELVLKTKAFQRVENKTPDSPKQPTREASVDSGISGIDGIEVIEEKPAVKRSAGEASTISYEAAQEAPDELPEYEIPAIDEEDINDEPPDDPFPDITFPVADKEMIFSDSPSDDEVYEIPEDDIPIPDISLESGPEDIEIPEIILDEDTPEDMAINTADNMAIDMSKNMAGAKNENPPSQESPQGLFNSRSNIGWEEYTLDRLASEIHRCASFEQDMVFLVMEFRDSKDLDDRLYRIFADEAVNFFSMRDLVFEREDKGISVIIPNTDLEQGMGKAEEYRSRIYSKMPPSFKGRSDLCIGLSSRSGRLVEAERVMLEASSALDRAIKDPDSPVIAFKSDPEKYREFVRGNLKV